jgi:hypothetical protein
LSSEYLKRKHGIILEVESMCEICMLNC